MIRTLWAMAAVVAIFAMHGLAAHAGDPQAMAPAPSVGTASVGTASVSEPAGHPVTAPPVGSSHEAIGSMHGMAHSMSVLGLCVAVVATAAIAMLRVTRPRSGLLAVLPRSTTPAMAPAFFRGEHGPPDLHALSILRC